jgi:cytochrome b subunit of formate dehydrogenase
MSVERAQPQYFIRMTLSQRIQHVLIIISFITLALTGFPLRFATSSVAQSMVRFMGGYAVRAQLHRVAAVIMIAVTVYHFGAVAVGVWRNRRKIRE